MIPFVSRKLLAPSFTVNELRLPILVKSPVKRHLPYARVQFASSQIELRDYQEECIQSVLQSLKDGHKRLGISLATGSGKTVIFTQLIQRVQPRETIATQTLILAHRRELVEQAARHCTNAYPDSTVEIEMGSMHASGTADITIASLQSITSGDRLNKFDPQRFKLVLVDEAHHIVAPGYMRVLGHFGLDSKKVNSPSLVGVSATFSRFDGLKLGAAIDQIVYHKDYVDMIGDKWLSDVMFTTVESTADLSRVKNGANGDFQPGELSRAVNTDQINEITVRSWLAKASDRKSTLVFCVDLAHVAGLTQTFRKHGYDARFVTGDTHKVERAKTLEDFRSGKFPVLVNCGVFTEGTDIPNIDCVILARPTRSRNLLVQMIGRGMRLHKGKSDCHIIDMVSSLQTGIVSAPTLFGLDPSEIVSEATTADMEEIKGRKEAEKLRQDHAYSDASAPEATAPTKSVTFTDYDSVFDLIQDTSGEQHIRAISQYAWVQVGQDKYVLCAPNGSYIRLFKVDAKTKFDDDDGGDKEQLLWQAVEVRTLPSGVAKSPFAAPRELLQAATFADAVHGSDNYVSNSELYPHTFVQRWQRWRKGPPTPGQLDFLNKLRPKEEPLTAANVDKGKAMDMITKIRHGAKGRFASLKTEKRRVQRSHDKKAQMEARARQEKVSVGPISS
ncbi:P-loop containing nucleoside triphosphate hydrolase protein [Colletotrichum godetiae]|uniref:P-loop containing nucleoside triphosphate hydrolase protein n=1 Tax=Colletotrichum godetiae TaxID=1209918 RepID=A0AAJ0EY43_9PEZI|nr:P-loop containing nucleoside triphosphate hydrolase protein [Colletotrichum godetiae]KAK1699687.1 P-loop containing nucleoside triphosphate hydrolase protein [Colletotrichum godetiae]